MEVREEYVHQLGNRGMFARVELRVEPAESGSGFNFVNELSAGKLSREFAEAVKAGSQDALSVGALAGYPVIDLAVTLTRAGVHEVDSDEISFRVAANRAVNQALRDGEPVLLEPLMAVEIVVPEKYLGDVIGDVNARRGTVLGMEARGRMQVVSCLVPLAEMFGYSTDLRSLTQGRANYTMRFKQYEPVPSQIRDQMVLRLRGY